MTLDLSGPLTRILFSIITTIELYGMNSLDLKVTLSWLIALLELMLSTNRNYLYGSLEQFEPGAVNLIIGNAI